MSKPLTSEWSSPYETEARYSTKRGQSWIGYKVHLTETCDDDLPHLLTQVETTIAPVPDVVQLDSIQRDLAKADLLPAQHLVDAGYVRALNLVTSRTKHQVDLIGPTSEDHQWQAKAGEGFDTAHFDVDWDRHVVTCPQGRQSIRWCVTETARQRTLIHIDFAQAECAVCLARSQCTRAKAQPRSLTLPSATEHKALQAARERQQSSAFKVLYARQAGVEGTISQGVRAFGLRQARYRGLDKTHRQHVATAAAINVGRLANWLNEVPVAVTRLSRFAALAALN
ncbi:MAG: transposase [Chloroflexi bacterium]|nr:transposase [Chloroflexota bacterium]